MKRLPIIILALAIIGIGVFTITRKQTSKMDTNAFVNEKRTPHFESSTPEHNDVLAAAPTNVVINVNLDLVSIKSTIKVTRDGNEYFTDDTYIESNKLAMRRGFPNNAMDGRYLVNYKACWQDGGCNDGQFRFTIERGKASSFLDMRNKPEVQVQLSQIKFQPMEIGISKGTKVIWTNDDEVEHYVNTDSHPAHTYYPSQNSKALKKGDTFSTTFDTPGIYPYHCSAHAAVMAGSVVVD